LFYHDKGEVLRYAIAFALRPPARSGLKEGLTEEERYAVADHAVAQLKDHGDPWRLNEAATTANAAIDMKRFRRLDGSHPRHPPSGLPRPGLFIALSKVFPSRLDSLPFS
jgi:hypothetical protein